MSVKNSILTIGFDKNGEADFGASCAVCDLSYEQMKELRAIIPVAISIMEDMWRRENEKKQQAQCCAAVVN